MKKLLKRALALSLCVCMVVGMSTGASAADNYEIINNDFGKIEIINENFAGVKGLSNIVTFSEYDLIVNFRQSDIIQRKAFGLSKVEESEMLSSSAEAEYLKRSKLSTNELKNIYGYNDKAIECLRRYKGEALEDYPEAATFAAQLSIGSSTLLYGGNTSGMCFGWEWNVTPSLNARFSDVVGVAWSGTYASGYSNNIAINTSKSYTNVEYYHYDRFIKTVRNSLSVSKSYHDASTAFPMTQAGELLAKKGATFLYVNTVNNSIPLIETAFSFSYGNRRAVGIPSVSFPGGLNISFDGQTVNMGTYAIRLKPNGQVLF